MRTICYIDPLTYGVEGLRAALLGTSAIGVPVSFIVCTAWAVLLVAASA